MGIPTINLHQTTNPFSSRVAILFALFTVTSPVRVFADSAVAVQPLLLPPAQAEDRRLRLREEVHLQHRVPTTRTRSGNLNKRKRIAHAQHPSPTQHLYVHLTGAVAQQRTTTRQRSLNDCRTPSPRTPPPRPVRVLRTRKIAAREQVLGKGRTTGRFIRRADRKRGSVPPPHLETDTVGRASSLWNARELAGHNLLRLPQDIHHTGSGRGQLERPGQDVVQANE